MPDFAGTDKQIEILDLVFAAADAGRDIEFWELKGALSYGPDVTKQAIQYSLRYLDRHGLITRKYGADRKLFIAPTLLAYNMLRRNTGLSMDPDPSPSP